MKYTERQAEKAAGVKQGRRALRASLQGRWIHQTKESVELPAAKSHWGHRARARKAFTYVAVGTWHFTKADAAKLRAERGV